MGVGSANVIYLPVANRLKALSKAEVELRTLTLEGILSVQAGDNPRVVAEKLGSFVPPAERNSDEGASVTPDASGRGGRERWPRWPVARQARSRREHENEERWLLTYADMLTLLFALFMVLFSISSVNISKYQSPAAVAQGRLLRLDPARRQAIIQSGSESTKAHTPATAEVAAIVPLTPNIPKPTAHVGVSRSARRCESPRSAAKAGAAGLQQLKREARRLRQGARLRQRVQTVIEQRGLVVRVLTDKLLFDSGQATLQPAGCRCSKRWRSCSMLTASIRSRWKEIRTTADPELAVPQQLGAVDRPGHHRRSLPDRPRRRRSSGCRRPAMPTCIRWRATPPRRARAATGAWTSCLRPHLPRPEPLRTTPT